MERLTLSQEAEIREFRSLLDGVVGLDDLFPPEEGVRELRPQPQPKLPPAVAFAGKTVLYSSLEEPVLVAA